MPIIREKSIDDLISSLPDWSETGWEGADIFIAAAGFEHRSPRAFKDWCESIKPITGILLLIEYPMNINDNRDQIDEFIKCANKYHIEIIKIPYDRTTFYRQFSEIIKSKADTKRIIIDLSSFASFILYPVLENICQLNEKTNLHVVYTEAGEYFPTEEEYQEFRNKVKDAIKNDIVEYGRLFDSSCFQSMGTTIAYESQIFPGKNHDKLPTKLIVIPNFSFERVNRMISFSVEQYSVKREDIEWILGVPPNQEKNGWRTSAITDIFQPTEKHHVNTLHYKEILKTLNDIYMSSYMNYHLMISTVGSKAQHLGTFIFLKIHPEVGLVLSEPEKFNAAKYSKSDGQLWHMNFGDLGIMNDRILNWNKIDFIW